jgi:hypothetical protein
MRRLETPQIVGFTGKTGGTKLAHPVGEELKMLEINKLVIGGLAAGCLATAGGGAYLATRHLAAEQAVPSATAPAPVPDRAPVTESEGLLTPAVEPEPAAPAPAPEPRASAPAPKPAAPARPAPAPTVRRASTTPPAERVVSPPPPRAEAAVPTGSMWESRPAVEPNRPERAEPQVAAPVREYVDLVVPADSVLGLQIDRTVSSETALTEDRVEARVSRDVRVGDRVAIPAGAVVHGSVTDVEQGGKVKERARLAIRFHTVVLADGTRLALRTDELVREGQAPGGASAAKIGGGAVAGAIIGGIFGGGRGAAIGGSVGAAGGTAAVMTGDRNPAVLASGSTVTVRIQEPVRVTVEQ